MLLDTIYKKMYKKYIQSDVFLNKEYYGLSSVMYRYHLFKDAEFCKVSYSKNIYKTHKIFYIIDR